MSNGSLWSPWLACVSSSQAQAEGFSPPPQEECCFDTRHLLWPQFACVSHHKTFQACLDSLKRICLPLLIWISPSSCLNNPLPTLFCFPLPLLLSIKLAFGILKLNLFKSKQLGACISQTKVTDHTRKPKTSGAEDLAGLCLSGDAELIVMFPKGITQGSKVELFTNTMISPQMQLLLQLIKRTIKTKAISQVHRFDSFSPLSDAALAPRGLNLIHSFRKWQEEAIKYLKTIKMQSYCSWAKPLTRDQCQAT